MTSPIARLWHHGEHSGRQKQPAVAAVPAPPAVVVAHSKMPNGPQGVLAVAVPPVTEPEVPDKDVQCLACGVPGRSSQIPDIGWGPRCADIEACTVRFREASRPLALPEPEPALPVLPEAQEKALASFHGAHDEEDAREAGAAPEADGDAPEPDAPDGEPAGETRAEGDDRIPVPASAFEGLREPLPPEAREALAAEARAEGEEPEPAAEEPPVPVAEVPAEPVHEPQEDDEGEEG